MNPLHFKGWTDQDHIQLESAQSFAELADIALRIISRLPLPLNMVSGPISTGGVGTVSGNRLVFNGVIEILTLEKGLNLFSQMPFEDKMAELYKIWRISNPDMNYCMPILEDFYEKVFSSGKIRSLYFIHGYESSFGARWEHEGCDRWGISRIYLPQELSQNIIDKINH